MAPRLAIAVWLLALSTACTPMRVIRLETGQGAPLKYLPPTSSQAVGVDEDDFEDALTRLMLEAPMPLRSAQQGWLVRTSSSGVTANTSWHHLLRRSFGGVCKPQQPRLDCLSLLDDVVGLSAEQKLAVALGLSLEPMRQSIAETVEDTLTPQFFYVAVLSGMVSWVALAAAPEPVFTKTAAVVTALLLVYLGVDAFLEVVKASLELKRATDRATTFAELEQAGQRFGPVLGTQGARVLILAVTLLVSRGTVGGATWLASRLPLLPSFAEASALGASQLGFRLESVGQVSSVAVVEGNLVISLAPTAVAMAARGPGAEEATQASPSGYRAWGSFSGFRKAMGPAGEGKEWHHVVEQTPGNVERFGPQALHNTENVIPLELGPHKEVSRLYSSIRPDITNSRSLTVRQWLSTQSYEAQRAFGLRTIENVRKGAWP